MSVDLRVVAEIECHVTVDDNDDGEEVEQAVQNLIGHTGAQVVTVLWTDVE
jgi:hypothetical protein